jgi:hypothetical protein
MCSDNTEAPAAKYKSSSQRKRASSNHWKHWIPACAGMASEAEVNVSSKNDPALSPSLTCLRAAAGKRLLLASALLQAPHTNASSKIIALWPKVSTNSRSKMTRIFMDLFL